ncbi:MAG: Smr/MutS family protein [Polyangia bacterium]|jgi:DNA-nicking Smr family endonuclease
MDSRKPASPADAPPPAARNRQAAEEEERRLFEAAMQGVRPLPLGPRRAVPDWEAEPPAPTAKQRPRRLREALHVEEDGERLTGAAFGVAHDLVRSLARGEIVPEAELDLHHLTADVAAHQAERFIEQAVAKGRRCVLLIHGRGLHSGPGGPALRPALVEILCRRPLAEQVLAFTSAPPRHGGPGALLLLLRRPRLNHA